MTFLETLVQHLRAGYPALQIVTPEPDRLKACLSRLDHNRTVLVWDCLRGVTHPNGSRVEAVTDPVQMIGWLTPQHDVLLLAENFHHFAGSVDVMQALMNAVPVWKGSGITLAAPGPLRPLPEEIARYFTVLDFPLPTAEELSALQGELGAPYQIPADGAAVAAAKGLTEFEAETAFSYAVITAKSFDAGVVTGQKKAMIRRTGLMDFWPQVPEEDVGGLTPLKTYIRNRIQALSGPASTLPRLKALLLLGIPGTGKSLAAKATASIVGWPLIRLDIGSLKGSLVGQSEAQLRQALRTVEAFGQSVLWLDEIEKAFSGVASSGLTDGGTTASMFGTFLTWMQETTAPVLIVATANDLSALPPEFLRAGRFDATFFVDTPNARERREIVRIMNRRYGSEIPEALADRLAGWTGAELEQLAKDSLFDGLEAALAAIVPLSKTMAEKIEALKAWAANRARRANDPDLSEAPRPRRLDAALN